MAAQDCEGLVSPPPPVLGIIYGFVDVVKHNVAPTCFPTCFLLYVVVSVDGYNRPCYSNQNDKIRSFFGFPHVHVPLYDSESSRPTPSMAFLRCHRPRYPLRLLSSRLASDFFRTGRVYASSPGSPTAPTTWVDRLPPKVQPYLYLTRIDKPIGTLLLFYPCSASVQPLDPL